MAYVNFSNRFLDEIRARVSVSEIVGRKVKLVRKGKEHHGLCPFHNEKTPSFTVNDQKGFYHCFGCGAHGDAIRFLTDGEGVAFPEAVEQLARKAGLEMPKATPKQVAEQKQQATLADVVALASHWFHANLQQRPPRMVLDYLKSRGLDEPLQQQFQLGYAPESFNSLQDYLKSKEVPVALMKAAGLVSSGNNGDYDKFRQRLMFPIADMRGRVIAFGGRILGEGKPKYLNSPETELFKKGEVLYNYHHARGKAYESGQMVVAEGYMDVIALHRAGIEAAVAPLGTAVTSQQLQLLWKCVDEPIFCLDGDAAGQRAMERAAHLALPMLSAGKSLRFTVLPKGMDPDDVLKSEGANALKKMIAAARPLSEVLWNIEQQKEPLATPEQKANLEHRLERLAATISHSGVQNHYRMFFREKMWKINRRDANKKTTSSAAAHASIQAPHVELEEQIMALICAFPNLLHDEALNDSLHSMEFSSKNLDKIRLFALEECAAELSSASQLQDALEKAGFYKDMKRFQQVQRSIAMDAVKLQEDNVKMLLDYHIANLHLLHLKEEQQQIRLQFTEEAEARANAFQEEIDRWTDRLQQLELQDF